MELFIGRSADKYLRNNGKMGFITPLITPLAALSREQYEGFRSGKWGNYLRCKFTELWGLEQVKPKGFFPVPSAVIFGTKQICSPEEPLDRLPSGFPKLKKVFTGVRVPDDWQATYRSMIITEEPNAALGKHTEKKSDYDDLTLNGATIYPRIFFFVTEETHTTMNRLGRSRGTTTVHAYRTTNEKQPWKSLPSWQAQTLSSRFVFDVHLGSTIVPFALRQPWRAVLPIDQQRLMSEEDIDKAETGLRTWWRIASEQWEENNPKGSKFPLPNRLDYHRGLTNQLDPVKHRVLYTKSGSILAAARIQDPKVIVDHKLYWMPTSGLSEARYLTGILNAPVTTELVSVYQSRGLFGTRDFDKNVWRLPIPHYDSHSELHAQIVSLAEQAEKIAAAVDGNSYGFQKHRKLVRKALDEKGVTEQINNAVKALLGEE